MLYYMGILQFFVIMIPAKPDDRMSIEDILIGNFPHSAITLG